MRNLFAKLLVVIALAATSFLAQAQALSASQLTALRAAVFLDPAANALLVVGNSSGLRTYLNTPTNPAWIAWRTDVPVDSIMSNGMDWTRVDNLSVGKSRIWDWMGRLGTLNCAKANIRAGIDATWVGTAADLAVRATVYTHCKRAATNAEKMLATGTGTDAAPGLTTFQGDVIERDSTMLVFRDDGTIWTP